MSAIRDFSQLTPGTRVKCPPGTVHVCPRCGQRGLRRVYSWTRGRYRVVYVHEVERLEDGTHVALGTCSVGSSSLAELPAEERKLGRG